MVSVKSNDASLRLLISVFMISKYAKCCRWTSGSAPVLYPGRHTPQGRRLAYRTSLSNSTTHGSRWMVRVHTNNSHTKQCHIVSGPQSLTMTQTCYHPPKFRNEFPKYYCIGQIPYIHAIQQQIHSRLPQYISQYSRGIQLLAMPPAHPSTSPFHGTPDQ